MNQVLERIAAIELVDGGLLFFLVKHPTTTLSFIMGMGPADENGRSAEEEEGQAQRQQQTPQRGGCGQNRPPKIGRKLGKDAVIPWERSPRRRP